MSYPRGETYMPRDESEGQKEGDLQDAESQFE